MSTTFFADNVDHAVNMASANAAEIVVLLGLSTQDDIQEAGGPFGSIDAVELSWRIVDAAQRTESTYQQAKLRQLSLLARSAVLAREVVRWS